MSQIIEETSMEAWLGIVDEVIKNGKEFKDGKGRVFKQILNNNLIILNPKQDISKPINTISRSEKWLYPTIDEIKRIFLKKETVPTYEYTYGQRLFNFNDQINQIDHFVIPYFKDKIKKNSRRLFVSTWNPIKDSKYGTDHEIHGIVGIWFKLVENKITATVIIRNNDCFVGFPANLYQIHILQKYISEKTGFETGRIVIYSLSMHIYMDHLDDIKLLIGNHF